jgi:hypothetical protein
MQVSGEVILPPLLCDAEHLAGNLAKVSEACPYCV